MGTTDIMYSYVLSLLSIVLIISIAYIQIKAKKNNIRQWSTLILTCALIANIADMFQILNISNASTWTFFQAFTYIGQTMLPICVFFAIAYYVEPDFHFKPRHLCLFYIPIITILCMFTNNLHGLVFEVYSPNFAECSYGYIFYVYIINVFITYILSFGMLFRHFYNKEKQSWTRIFLVSLCFIIPCLIYISGILRFLEFKVYIIEIVQSIMSIVLVYEFFKYELLTELPISLNNILNSISDSYAVINDKKEIIMYNDMFLTTFNLGKLNINGMNFSDLIEYKEFDTITEDDIDDLLDIKTRSKKLSFERSSNVLEKTLKYEGEVLSMNKRETLYLIFITDTTEYSKNMELLKVNHDVNIGRERLASLGQMIGGIAHNLKTPIFSIAGAIEGLDSLTNEYMESIDDPEVLPEDHKAIANEMQDWNEKIKGYLSYMTDIIDAIQDQTSTEKKETTYETFTVSELIKYVDILMKYELDKNMVTLKINSKLDDNKAISGNVNTLVQVLNNLISNAIQAYKDDNNNKIIELNLYEKDNKIRIEVVDYAGGIPKEIQDKLFKEMVTTKGKNGTGLGLFISYANIKTGFGGNLTFYSKEGKGTIFRVIIPEKS